jgi:hypothetical protein
VAEAVANTLVQLLKSVEVTPDRLAKRYPEVCMTVDPYLGHKNLGHRGSCTLLGTFLASVGLFYQHLVLS